MERINPSKFNGKVVLPPASDDVRLGAPADAACTHATQEAAPKSDVLIALVQLLARQAAREAFATRCTIQSEQET